MTSFIDEEWAVFRAGLFTSAIGSAIGAMARMAIPGKIVGNTIALAVLACTFAVLLVATEIHVSRPRRPS